MFAAVDPIVQTGLDLGAVQLAVELLEDDVVDQRGLARAGDASDAGKEPQGDAGLDVLEVVLARALDGKPLAIARTALVGDGDCVLAGEVAAGDGAGAALDLARRAADHQFAAALAGARAEIDDEVGRTHRFLIVLDDDDGVADIAQALEGGQQALVVAVVQADRGFVEDVEHADQSRADLRGEADALRFAAGEGVGAAVEGEIAQAHVAHQVQAAADLLEGFLGDERPGVGEGHGVEEVAGILDGDGGELRHIAPFDLDR